MHGPPGAAQDLLSRQPQFQQFQQQFHEQQNGSSASTNGGVDKPGHAQGLQLLHMLQHKQGSGASGLHGMTRNQQGHAEASGLQNVHHQHPGAHAFGAHVRGLDQPVAPPQSLWQRQGYDHGPKNSMPPFQYPQQQLPPGFGPPPSRPPPGFGAPIDQGRPPALGHYQESIDDPQRPCDLPPGPRPSPPLGFSGGAGLPGLPSIWGPAPGGSSDPAAQHVPSGGQLGARDPPPSLWEQQQQHPQQSPWNPVPPGASPGWGAGANGFGEEAPQRDHHLHQHHTPPQPGWGREGAFGQDDGQHAPSHGPPHPGAPWESGGLGPGRPAPSPPPRPVGGLWDQGPFAPPGFQPPPGTDQLLGGGPPPMTTPRPDWQPAPGGTHGVSPVLAQLLDPQRVAQLEAQMGRERALAVLQEALRLHAIQERAQQQQQQQQQALLLAHALQEQGQLAQQEALLAALLAGRDPRGLPHVLSSPPPRAIAPPPAPQPPLRPFHQSPHQSHTSTDGLNALLSRMQLHGGATNGAGPNTTGGGGGGPEDPPHQSPGNAAQGTPTPPVRSTSDASGPPPRADQGTPGQRGGARDRKRPWQVGELDSELTALAAELTPGPEEVATLSRAVQGVRDLLLAEFPQAQVHLYGSAANGLCVARTNDIDVCLDLGPEYDMLAAKSQAITQLGKALAEAQVDELLVLPNARVPVVKFVWPSTATSVDVTINNNLPLENTRLLATYAALDPRLRQLVMCVKHWAKRRGVNDTYRGSLSSYAYVLMCIGLLQQRNPPILPALQQLPRKPKNVAGWDCSFCDDVQSLKDFGAGNTDSLAELFDAFFQYWGRQHEYNTAVLSVRTGGLLSKRSKDWVKRQDRDRHLVCIEDPFELTHDLGRCVDWQSIRTLRSEFERAAQILATDADPLPRLLTPVR